MLPTIDRISVFVMILYKLSDSAINAVLRIFIAEILRKAAIELPIAATIICHLAFFQ